MAGDAAYAVWTDTRNNNPAAKQTGNQDIFFSRFPVVPATAPPDDRFDPNNSPTTAADDLATLEREAHRP